MLTVNHKDLIIFLKNGKIVFSWMLCKMNSQKSMAVHTSNKPSTFPIQYPRFKIWIILLDENNNKSIVLLSNKKIQNGFKTLHGKIRYKEDLRAAVFRVANWLIGTQVAKKIYELNSHIQELGEPVNFSFHNNKNKLIHTSCQHYKIEFSCSAEEFMDIVSEYKRSQIKILSFGDILKIREHNPNRISYSEELILFPEDIESVKKIFEV